MLRVRFAMLLVIVVATAGAAVRVDDAAPVVIDRCRLEYSDTTLSKKTGLLEIKYTNEGDKDVAAIRFTIDLDGKTISIRDSGPYTSAGRPEAAAMPALSGGITVVHQFNDLAGDSVFRLSRAAQPKCSVSYVRFTDNTVWRPANAATPAPPPVYVAPPPTPAPTVLATPIPLPPTPAPTIAPLAVPVTPAPIAPAAIATASPPTPEPSPTRPPLLLPAPFDVPPQAPTATPRAAATVLPSAPTLPGPAVINGPPVVTGPPAGLPTPTPRPHESDRTL